jgi:hypothetical protein
MDRRENLRPFWPGHELSTTHGAWSDARVRPVADRLSAEIVSTAPWLSQAPFRPAIAAWARTEAQTQLVVSYLDEHGYLDTKGRPRAATNLLERLEGRARRLRNDLGLSPVAWAHLVAALDGLGEATQELDELRRIGSRILEERSGKP